MDYGGTARTAMNIDSRRVGFLEGLSRGEGPKTAVVAMACKIAGDMDDDYREGPYEPRKQRRHDKKLNSAAKQCFGGVEMIFERNSFEDQKNE